MSRRSRGKSSPGDPVFLAEMTAIREAHQAAERARLAVTDEERARLSRLITRPFSPYAPLRGRPPFEPIRW